MASQTQYILSKRIARGGMAEIFLGKGIGSDDFERICAIKRILPHYSGDKEFTDMFRGEANICKRLQHANIVQVYDFKKVDGHYAIVMEFVNGTDLRSLLANCEKKGIRPSVPVAVYIASCVARGLHYAHTKCDDVTRKPLGIVHRDISPQNILISFEGDVKVIDFGIADFESKNMETKPGIVKGKYSYMSPEQVSAEKLDSRTDVFSLGITLWEMLAMKRLFGADSEVETIKNVQKGLIKPELKTLNPAVDQDLMNIINKSLQKDRSRRYSSGDEFEKDLTRYRNSKYPNFNPVDLGHFLKDLLAEQRTEMEKDIQHLLSIPSESFLQNQPVNIPAPPIKSNIQSLPVARQNVAQNRQLQPPPMQAASGITFQNIAHTRGGPRKKRYKRSNNLNQNSQKSRSSHQRPAPSVHRQAPIAKYATMVPVRQSPGSNALLYLFAIAALILIGLGIHLAQSRIQAKNSVEFYLQTEPSIVKIKLDGRPLFDGKYIKTPLKIAIPSGKHTMKIERSTYKNRIIKFLGKPGDKFSERGLRLNAIANTVKIPTDIVASDNSRVYFSMNDGFEKGFTPRLLGDIEPGTSYAITVYPNAPKRDGAFQCQFLPDILEGQKQYQITVYIEADSNKSRCVAKSK